MDSVDKILAEKGPMLGSAVSKYYRDLGLSPAAARQRVSRASSNVHSLYGLPFPKNTKFLYLENEFGSKRFFDSLIATLMESGPAYACAISGISARGGICLASEWDIVSGSPVLQSKHLASQEVLKRLKSVKLLETINVSGLGDCIFLSVEVGRQMNLSSFRARLTLEQIISEVVKNWAVRMGYSSTNTISTKNADKPPQFGTFRFDIVGPSYLHSLIKKTNSGFKNGYFVADVMWSDNLTLDEVSYFLKKVETLSYLKKMGNFQPMLVTNGFEKDALIECRSKGIMAVTLDTLLGHDIVQGLRDLLDTLSRAAAISAENPQKIGQIFDRLSTIEGLTGNIRGALFEMLVGHIVKKLNAGSIDIGVIAVDNRTKSKADVDVRLVTETHVTCFECKGHDSNILIDIDEVKYWLEKQVPTIYASLSHEQRFNHMKKRFEFWTAGKFDETAKKYLEDQKATVKKYEIDWKDGHQVLEQAKRLQGKTVYRTLKTHYFDKSLTATISPNHNQKNAPHSKDS